MYSGIVEERSEEFFDCIFDSDENARSTTTILVFIVIVELTVLYSALILQSDDLEDLPLLQFEIFATCARKIPLIELVHIWMFKVAWKIARCVRQFIRTVADQQIVAPAESGSVCFETADSLVFQRLDERILGSVRQGEDKGLSFEVCFEMS